MGLTATQRAFVNCKEPYPAFVGGFGCLRGSTKIATPHGFIAIQDLAFGDEVLSWSETDRKFLICPTSGGYPKGTANLYRVTTTRGEFVASAHHRVRVGQNSYQQVSELRVGQALSASDPSLPLTSSEFGRIWSPSNDLSYWQTLANYLDGCEGEDRQCGQQLLEAVNNGLVSSPSQADAQKYAAPFYPLKAGQKDGLQALKQRRSRQDQSYVHPERLDLKSPFYHPAQGAEGQNHALCAGRILRKRQRSRQFLLRSKLHRKDYGCAQRSAQILANGGEGLNCRAVASAYCGIALFPQHALYCAKPRRQSHGKFANRHSGGEFLISKQDSAKALNCSTIEAAIISIERLPDKEQYWDIHVAGCNNYLTEDGVIHHNSGKTAAGIVRAMALKCAFPKCDIAYYLPTYGLVEDVAYERIPAICEKNGWAYKLNKSSSTLTFPNAGKIIMRTMENPARIVGYQVAHSIIDELDILEREKARLAWNKIIARNRQNCFDDDGNRVRNSVAVVTTPEGFGFVYDRWVKEKKEGDGYALFRAKTIENADNLPPNYIADLTASYPSNLLQAYLEGEFVNLASGSVYHEFDRIKNRCDTEIKPGEALHIGMDFNVTNMAAVVFVIRDNDPHAAAELTQVFDTPAMARILKERYRDKGHPLYIYPDASGQSRKSVNASESDIAILRQAGFQVFVGTHNPAVKDRILSVNNVIHNQGNRRLKVNDTACPMFAEALEKQAYDKNGEPDKKSGLDHITDAGGYFISHRYPVQKPGATKLKITGA